MDLRLSKLGRRYDDGDTVFEVMLQVLEACDSYCDPAVFIKRLDREAILARAAELDAIAPANRGALHGVPFAVKDNIDVAGLPTTMGMATERPAAERTATAVQRVLDQGGVLIGKTNLDQFATGLVGVRSPYGAPHSVFDETMISGGSSSGSAIAVAAHLVSFSYGTDTAGSGRVPAAFNNIVGVKPTKGLIPTTGVFPANKSQDCVSVFALSVSDGDTVRRIAEGVDGLDPYARPAKPVNWTQKNLRIGVPSAASLEFFGDSAAADNYAEACTSLTKAGYTLVPFDFEPFAATARLLYESAWVAERTHAITPWLKASPDPLHPITREIVEDGLKYNAVDTFDAIYKATEAKVALDAIWNDIDVMLVPTTPSFYSLAELEAEPILHNKQLGYYTNCVNLLDYAAIAVPAGFRTDGLPAGVTLVAPAFTDGALAQLGGQIHRLLSPTTGRDCLAVTPEDDPDTEDGNHVDLAVVGAHLSGMPLNHQLTDRGGFLLESVKTSPDYRLYALVDTSPPKPGLVRDTGTNGAEIALEIWRLPEDILGNFLKLIPAPLGLGTILLSDGRQVKGFICESRAMGLAVDITEYGGWKAYLAAKQ
ncbi:allophanate hydrolase [Celeribacter halophilus]|uniref:Allophanate hydrolase n=1 Tax=Celeribacter halophilus TaxID=576117 RepID=A0AAW7XZH5_9RHOB|nr:allophanate hydrolase [Celeribacter halophilus]MDO6458734.1 allophanate hydrolase [Celeribacter halophilus]